MSELRYDPLRGRWALIDQEEVFRPLAREAAALPRQEASDCPVCPGKEHLCGHELVHIKGEGWSVKVVPNGRPVLMVERELKRSFHGPYDIVNGVGAHEVVVETQKHGVDLGDLSIDNIKGVFSALRSRFLDLRRDMRLRYHIFIKNKGIETGARLAHSVSQIICTPVIPSEKAVEITNAKAHLKAKERCLLCDLLDYERAGGERIIYESRRFVALCPFASASPFEIMIIPKFHSHDFAFSGDDDLILLSEAVKKVLGRIKSELGDPAYVLTVNTAPPDHPPSGDQGYLKGVESWWHWYVRITPRISRITGLESDLGFCVNPVSPEQAASILK